MEDNQLPERKKKNVKLECPRCHNVWTYKGRNPYHAPCSYCGVNVSINNNQVV